MDGTEGSGRFLISDSDFGGATGANAVSVAEYVIAAILMLTRGVFGSSTEVLAGEWPRQRLLGREVSGKTLGLVGFGATAREVAVRARAPSKST